MVPETDRFCNAGDDAFDGCVRDAQPAAPCWLGLPVQWLTWWGRWMCESVATHYSDTPDDFVVADNVELPWPGAQAGMEWEWRVVSLKEIFPGELLALRVQDKDVGPEEDLGGWRGEDADTESRSARGQTGAWRQPACRTMWRGDTWRVTRRGWERKDPECHCGLCGCLGVLGVRAWRWAPRWGGSH